jgi:hypothetical protein
MATQNNANRQQSIFCNQSTVIAKHIQERKETLLTTIKVATIPRFSKAQRVRFVGGVGTIKNYWLESGTWTYNIEMEMGPEPDAGRVGNETKILLHEADIHRVIN